MWLLEHDGDVFEGRKLWLRPGKTYLFGRTPSEGNHQFLAIRDKHVSRKHLIVRVAAVPEGCAADPDHRSKVIVEDLKTKNGTKVNGKTVKGEELGLTKDDNEVQLGLFEDLFRLKWQPVVIGFSFSKMEMEKGEAVKTIRELLEPLDIKYTLDSKVTSAVTHVHSRKRNTPRVLQALVDGKNVIMEGFTDAIARAAVPRFNEDSAEVSPLEEDFDANWPNALEFLPAATDGPGANLSDEAFAPDERRREIFDGYTFIFYTKKSYEALVHVITGGKGKALLREVIPGETDIKDFVRYVKSVAGEKGLGEFEDGSEGRGVVVVRYVTNENEEWYVNFFNGVALQLDHRPIETRDFLPAVLAMEPAQLRRPLEVESTPREPAHQEQSRPANATRDSAPMDIDEVPESPGAENSPSPPPPPQRTTGRRQKKFKGFDADDDDDDDEVPTPVEASQGMFLTQMDEVMAPPSLYTNSTARSQTQTHRKRSAPPPDRDLLAELAPTTARIKRVRREGGEDPVPLPPKSAPPPAYEEPEKIKGKGRVLTKGGKKKNKASDCSGDELLDKLIQAGKEEENQRAAEEKLFLKQLQEGEIDLKDIRDSMTVLQINLRQPNAARGRQDDEVADGRWDDKWNSLRNFKKFRKQTNLVDTAISRTAPKKIVSVEPVPNKEYGIGDEYWLTRPQALAKNEERVTKQQTQNTNSTRSIAARPGRQQARAPMTSDSEDSDGASLPEVIEIDAPLEPARSRKGKGAARAGARQSQAARSGTQRQSQNKRSAPEPPPGAQPSKRRATPAARSRAIDDSEDEDEEGGMSFRFGTRK